MCIQISDHTHFSRTNILDIEIAKSHNTIIFTELLPRFSSRSCGNIDNNEAHRTITMGSLKMAFKFLAMKKQKRKSKEFHHFIISQSVNFVTLQLL